MRCLIDRAPIKRRLSPGRSSVRSVAIWRDCQMSDQLTIAAAVTVILVTLLLLRWLPSWGHLLSAATAAALIDLAINGHEVHAFDPGPHACPCAAAIFVGVLAVIHKLDGNQS